MRETSGKNTHKEPGNDEKQNNNKKPALREGRLKISKGLKDLKILQMPD